MKTHAPASRSYATFKRILRLHPVMNSLQLQTSYCPFTAHLPNLNQHAVGGALQIFSRMLPDQGIPSQSRQ
jgi:hypothetical protein